MPRKLRAELDAASQPATPFPYYMFGDAQQTRLHGGVGVGDKPPGYAPPVWVDLIEPREVKATR